MDSKNLKSLKKNDEIELKIERFGDNGEGIAVFDEKVIFVPFAVPGEFVRVKIVADKGSYFYAKLLDVLNPSPSRIKPPCKYFKKCGGCDLQHLNYQSQLELKRRKVENCLLKFGGIQTKVEDVFPSEKEFRYRNKFAFPVQEKDGRTIIGMYRKNSHDVVELDDCLLQSENVKIILKIFKEYIDECKLSAFNEEKKTGLIKHIVAREGRGGFVLTVVVTDEKFNNFKPLIEKLKSKFENFGIVKNVNKLNNNVIFGNFDEKIYGNDELEFNDFGIKYFINNRSFLQVNNSVRNKIYEAISNELSGENNVIDAYSGAGLLSAILSKKCKQVFGVEIIKEATENANNLKKLNNLYNLTNINGDCTKIVPELSQKLSGDFSVVIDPPRKGVSVEVLSVLLSSQPKKIIYLSCNPSTLARDLKILSQKYECYFVKPFDMFAQTSNLETLVFLKLKGANWYGKWSKSKIAKYK